MQETVLSKLSSEIEESKTLSFLGKIKDQDVISFAAGESFLPTPYSITSKIPEAINKGYTRYTPAAGLPELRKAIADKLNVENGIECAPTNILVSAGAKQAIYNVMLAILDPGDEVIIPVPYWTSYPDMVKMCGAKPVFANTTCTGLKLRPEALKNAVTNKTKLIILNYPCNPSGVSYTRDELIGLYEAAPRNACFLCDEIYEKVIFDSFKHYSLASMVNSNNVITINGFSKSHCMTGWRVGYACASEDIIKSATNFQSHTTSGTNSIAQYCATFALKDTYFCERALNTYSQIRSAIIEELKGSEAFEFSPPQGGFYFFISIKKCLGKTYEGTVINNSQDFCRLLLERLKVACIPGIAFGDDTYIRLTFSIEKDKAIEGVKRLRTFASKLRQA